MPCCLVYDHHFKIVMMAAEKVGFFGGKNFLEREKESSSNNNDIEVQKRGYLELKEQKIFLNNAPKPNRPNDIWCA